MKLVEYKRFVFIQDKQRRFDHSPVPTLLPSKCNWRQNTRCIFHTRCNIDAGEGNTGRPWINSRIWNQFIWKITSRNKEKPGLICSIVDAILCGCRHCCVACSLVTTEHVLSMRPFSLQTHSCAPPCSLQRIPAYLGPYPAHRGRYGLMQPFNPRPAGPSLTPAFCWGGGGGGAAPPSISIPIDVAEKFSRQWRGLYEVFQIKFKNLTSGTCDVTGQVRHKMFDISILCLSSEKCRV